MGVKKLLNAGCGSTFSKVAREFAAYKEVRLDANKGVRPDIVASVVAMPMIDDESFEAVYCSHVLEHLYCFEVIQALREFRRVLKDDGVVYLGVPDLQSIGGLLALDKASNPIYQSPIGPVTPLDMIYGHQASVGAGNLFMAHRTGFTVSVLKAALEIAGFAEVDVERADPYELIAHARKVVCHSSAQSSTEGLLGSPLRNGMDEKTPFRQSRQIATAREEAQGEEEKSQTVGSMCH